MAYYRDLSPYTYWHSSQSESWTSVNVGWLDDAFPFEKAEPLESDLRLLRQYEKVVVNGLMGIHFCPFCVDDKDPSRDIRPSGSSETVIIGHNGTLYHAPKLILHYMERHWYAPPEEFLVALRTGISPLDRAYIGVLCGAGLQVDIMPGHPSSDMVGFYLPMDCKG